MSQASPEISLSELINKVKQELASTDKKDPAFIVETVELELQVKVSKQIEVKGQGEAKADLKISILSADLFKLGEAKGSAEASRKVNQENIHKIRVTLTPAILNDDFMDSLEPEEQEEIKQATRKVIVHGDDDNF